MFWRGQRRLRAAAVAAKAAFGPAFEALETRRLMSVDPGWSTVVGGCTVSYEHLYPDVSDSVGVVRVTGTGGDDVMSVTEAAGDSPSLRLDLNGEQFTLRLSDLSAGLHSVVLDGAAGNDRLSSGVSWSFAPVVDGSMWGVELRGGDGNDLLAGGTCAHAFDGGAGDDLIVGGDGRNFMSGGDGNDTLYGHGLAYDGHGADPTYDILDGGAGDDIVHGGANGWATVGDGNDLVLDGFAAAAGSHLAVHGVVWDQPAEYTAGDPILAAAAGRPIALVGDVLVVTGGAGDDEVTIAVDATDPAKLRVTVNGASETFDRAAVGRYLFDSRGGHDVLTVVDGMQGWVVRTRVGSDEVTVRNEPNLQPAAVPVVAPLEPATTGLETRVARRRELWAARQALRAARRAARRARLAGRVVNGDKSDRPVRRVGSEVAATSVLAGVMPGATLFGTRPIL